MKAPPGYEEAERAGDREAMDAALRAACVDGIWVRRGRIATHFENRPSGDHCLRLLVLSDDPEAAHLASLVEQASIGPGWAWTDTLKLTRLRQLSKLRIEGPAELEPLLTLPRLDSLHLVDTGPLEWPSRLRVSRLTLEGDSNVDVSRGGIRALTLRRRKLARVDGLEAASELQLLSAVSSSAARDLAVEGLPLRELDVLNGRRALRNVEHLPRTLERLSLHGSAAHLVVDLPSLSRLVIRTSKISLPRLEIEEARFERVTFAAPLVAPRLHTLELHGCDGLDFEGWELPSLRFLRLYRCDLETLAGLPSTPLETLEITQCHSLRDVSTLPVTSLRDATFSQCSDLGDVDAIARMVPAGGLRLHQTAVDKSAGDETLDRALGRVSKPKPPPALEPSAETRKHLASLGRLLRGKEATMATTVVELVRSLPHEVADAFLQGVRWNEELRRLLPGAVLAKARANHRGLVTLRLACELPEAEPLRHTIRALDLEGDEAAIESLPALIRLTQLRVTGGGFTGAGSLPLRELALADVRAPVVLWHLPKLERLELSGARARITLRGRVDQVLARDCVGIDDLLTEAQPRVFESDSEVSLPASIERLVWGPQRIVELHSLAHMGRLRTLNLRRARSVSGIVALKKHALEELVLPAPSTPSERDALEVLPPTIRKLRLAEWPLYRRDFRRLLHLERLEELVLEGMGSAWVDLPPELRPITTTLPRS